MTPEKKEKVDSNDAIGSALIDSKSQPSAEQQKNNNPQSKNATGENKPVIQPGKNVNSESLPEKINLSATELITGDKENVTKWIENPELGYRQLKGAVDLLDSAIELREDIFSEEKSKSKRIPSLDRRIETLDLFDNQIETGDRYLSDINKIKLQTELTNLREKRFLVWQKFVMACGSEKKALQYQHLRSKAKSKLYHSKSSYFIRQRILKILNTIIGNDKAALIEVKKLADHTSDDGIKMFNESMRELL